MIQRISVERFDDGSDYPRPRPPLGYADGRQVGGSVPIPGWVCERCGALVVRVDWHDEWHEDR